MKFGNIVPVETSRYLTKIAKVLVAKHMASLQLLCTVGGNQARLDAPTEFENLERSLKEAMEAGHNRKSKRAYLLHEKSYTH